MEMSIMDTNVKIKKQAEQILNLCDRFQKSGTIYQNQTITLRDCMKLEWLMFLLYLSCKNRKLKGYETTFLKDILSYSQTKEQMEQMYRQKNLGSDAFAMKIPRAVQEFVRMDLLNRLNGRVSTYAQMVVDFYDDLGQAFMACDNDTDEYELKLFTAYTMMLRNYLAKHEVACSRGPVQKLPKDPYAKENVKPAEKEQKAPSKEEITKTLEKLNALVGLDEVKEEVNSLVNLIKIRALRKERGLPSTALSLHMVFSGNPGTGKTTVARMLGSIYYNLGILSKGHLVEVDRSGMVSGYVGQTAMKTSEVIQKALGGILFIDEAYTLTANKGEKDFGQEAVDTLLKGMEDNRDNLVVIVAGYPDLVEEFLNSNPGLRSRFNRFIFFNDYTAEELTAIFTSNCERDKFTLTEEGKKFMLSYFEERTANKPENFANAREARNLFEKAIVAQANRLAAYDTITDEQLVSIELDDLKKCLEA